MLIVSEGFRCNQSITRNWFHWQNNCEKKCKGRTAPAVWFPAFLSRPFFPQKVLGNYIADFYSAEAKPVIELDGSQHYEQSYAQKDDERTAFLKRYGLTVIRIPNNEISQNSRGVCEYIDAAVKQSLSQPDGWQLLPQMVCAGICYFVLWLSAKDITLTRRGFPFSSADCRSYRARIPKLWLPQGFFRSCFCWDGYRNPDDTWCRS